MSWGSTVREELRVPTRELRHAIPQVYAGYKELHDSALAPGALDAKTKELIALAIAVSKECDPRPPNDIFGSNVRNGGWTVAHPFGLTIISVGNISHQRF